MAVGVLAAALAGGCTDVAQLPLPGGAPHGPSYQVMVEFADVLDLVPQAAVKVADVTVGRVERISLSGWTARVALRVDRSVRLPANATAAVRQTSLLGEKYVDLAAPTTEAARGELADHDLIPLSRTGRAAEVEEVLAALGLLLNGGGLAQLKIINEELATALTGRETVVRDALHQLDTFVGGLDQQKADLVRAVEALDRLTGHLAAQRALVGSALDSLGPGLAVLAEQRAQLSSALTALGELGAVGTRVVNASRDDTVASLRALQPLLDQLVRAGDALPKSLDFMLSYPFPPNVTTAIVGDFVNLGVTADLDASTILANLLVVPGPTVPAPALPALPRIPTPPNPGTVVPPLPGVLPPVCFPANLVLPPGWTPPPGCHLPPGCVLLPPGSLVPIGGLLPPGGVIPPGTVFPPGTRVPPGTVLTPPCLLPVTGAVNAVPGGLPDLLTGGLGR